MTTIFLEGTPRVASQSRNPFLTMNFRRFPVLLLLGACWLGSAAVADESATIEKLLQPRPRVGRVGPQYGNDREGFLKRSRALSQLCRERNTRDITPQLIVFLNDPANGIREHAAKALGVLERPEGEKPLVAELNKWEQYEKKLLSPPIISRATENPTLPLPVEEPNAASKFTIKLALGRIRSRRLKGRAKLDCIAQEFGLDYQDGTGVKPKAEFSKCSATATCRSESNLFTH